MRIKPRYTEKQKQKALAFYKEGYSSREVEIKTGVGHRTVARLTKKLGVSRKRGAFAPKTPHNFGKNANRWKGGIFDPSRRKYHLRKKFNMTLEEYELLLEKQNGVCALCGNPPVGRHLSVDHNHITGKIRGLLCVRCNQMISVFDDFNIGFEKIGNYLLKGN